MTDEAGRLGQLNHLSSNRTQCPPTLQPLLLSSVSSVRYLLRQTSRNLASSVVTLPSKSSVGPSYRGQCWERSGVLQTRKTTAGSPRLVPQRLFVSLPTHRRARRYQPLFSANVSHLSRVLLSIYTNAHEQLVLSRISRAILLHNSTPQARQYQDPLPQVSLLSLPKIRSNSRISSIAPAP